MNAFIAITPISRRALRIPYESPLLCIPREVASGSGSGGVSVLDILPTVRLPGPTLSVELVGVSVSLSWTDDVPNAYAYIIYRATDVNGPYSVQASGVVDRNFVDNPISGNYFYKVTAIEPNFGETFASNVVSVTVP